MLKRIFDVKEETALLISGAIFLGVGLISFYVDAFNIYIRLGYLVACSAGMFEFAKANREG